MTDYDALLEEPPTYSIFDVDSSVTATNTYLCLTTNISQDQVISYLKDDHGEDLERWANEPTEASTLAIYVVHPDAPHRAGHHRNADDLLGKIGFEYRLLHLDDEGNDDGEDDISDDEARKLITECLAGRHGKSVPASLLTGYLIGITYTSAETTRVLATSEQEAHDIVVDILAGTEPSADDVEVMVEHPEKIDPDSFRYRQVPVYRAAMKSISSDEAVALVGTPVERFDPNQLTLELAV